MEQISRAANTLQQESEAGAVSGPADIDTLMDELDGKKAADGANPDQKRIDNKNGGKGNGKGQRGRNGGSTRRRRGGGSPDEI